LAHLKNLLFLVAGRILAYRVGTPPTYYAAYLGRFNAPKLLVTLLIYQTSGTSLNKKQKVITYT